MRLKDSFWLLSPATGGWSWFFWALSTRSPWRWEKEEELGI